MVRTIRDIFGRELVHRVKRKVRYPTQARRVTPHALLGMSIYGQSTE